MFFSEPVYLQLAFLKILPEEIPLFTLHVHSKEHKYFGKHWAKNLEKMITDSEDFAHKSKFSIKAFCRIVREVQKRKKFGIFIFMLKKLKILKLISYK